MDRKTILCVARQYVRKRVADLFEAMPEVLRAVPGALVVVVGDGPEHGALRAQARDLHIEEAESFTGAISDELV